MAVAPRPLAPLTKTNLPDDIDVAIRTIASLSNLNDLPQDLIDQALVVERYNDAKKRGWKDERAANSMGWMAVRTLQLRKKNARNFDVNAAISRQVLARQGRDAVALIIDITKGQPKTISQIAGALGCLTEQAIFLVNYALQSKHLQIYSHGVAEKQTYVSTDEPYRYTKPSTPSERQARAERSLWVVKKATPASIIHYTIDLTPTGEQYLRQIFDPDQPACQLDAIVRNEKDAALRDTHKFRFAVTLNFAAGHPEATESPRTFLLRRTFGYLDIATDMITSGGQFDDDAVASFIRTDVPILTKHFERELRTAEKIGSPQEGKSQFTFSIAYAPVEDTTLLVPPTCQTDLVKEIPMKTKKVLSSILLPVLLVLSMAAAAFPSIGAGGHWSAFAKEMQEVVPGLLSLADHG